MTFVLVSEPCSNLPVREGIGAPIAILVLVAFLAIGLDAVVRPSRHMPRYLRRGGDMLRNLTELQVQLVGLMFGCASAWML